MNFAAKSLTAATLGLLLASPAAAGKGGASLADLAHAADLVALAQVQDTDYRRQRGIPVSGSAYLRILIPYKIDPAQDLVEVYEKGLHENECYFPDPTVFEEGRRYLLFLRRDLNEPDRYRALPQGCAIDVLVGSDNRYAVRMPVTGLALAASDREALVTLARPMRFADAYAIVADEELPPARRDAMRAARQIAPWSQGTGAADGMLPPSPSESRQWLYTKGVPLDEFRRLLRLQPDL